MTVQHFIFFWLISGLAAITMNTNKITGIYLCNFQSIKNPTLIKLDKPCFLYGPNSAGKSTILDALEIFSKFHSKEKLEKYFHKHAHDETLSPTIGIEYFSSMAVMAGIDKGDWEWWNKSLSDGYYSHPYQEFFSEIQGKLIQLQVGDFGASLSVAIEGEPLFEFSNHHLDVNEYGQVSDGSEPDFKEEDLEDTDLTIFGFLKVYKKSPYYKYLNWHLRQFSLSAEEREIVNKRKNLLNQFNCYYDLAVAEDTNEVIKLRGISFSLDNIWLQTSSYVYTDVCCENVFGYQYYSPEWPENVSLSEESKTEAHRYLEEMGSAKSSKYDSWDGERAHTELVNVANYFTNFVYGFIYEIQKVVKYAQVRGDRQLLDSEKIFAFHSYGKYNETYAPLVISGINYIDSKKTCMDRYASYLIKNLGDDNNSIYFSKKESEVDFVNLALTKYMPSLSKYSVFASGYEISKIFEVDKTNSGRLVYLSLNYKDKQLGFQDVGSGISYVFPILTALWSSNLCFVEQPELHLHPAGQCEIADVILAANKLGTISVVESHSEHLLLRIMRRIRETTEGYLIRDEFKLKPDDLRIYYFNPQGEGYTDVKEIRVDAYGELLNTWPGGFFSERERELFGE